MHADTWFHIAGFLNIKDRGRLYVAVRDVNHDWSDLRLHYFHSQQGSLKQLVQRNWAFIRDWSFLCNGQLVLPNGTPWSCWSPWCEGKHLYFGRFAVRVRFERAYDAAHAAFIKWLGSLRRRSLRRISLTTRYRCELPWKVPTRYGMKDIIFLPIVYFRIRVRVSEAKCPRVLRDGLMLTIEEFEFEPSNPPETF